MLMGLELSTMTKHLGFAPVRIPAAHQREAAASDLQERRTEVFSPQSAATAWPERVWTVLCVVSGTGISLWSRRVLGSASRDLAGGSSVGTSLHSPSPMRTDIIALGVPSPEGMDCPGSLAAVNHPVLADCKVDLHHL